MNLVACLSAADMCHRSHVGQNTTGEISPSRLLIGWNDCEFIKDHWQMTSVIIVFEAVALKKWETVTARQVKVYRRVVIKRSSKPGWSNKPIIGNIIVPQKKKRKRNSQRVSGLDTVGEEVKHMEGRKMWLQNKETMIIWNKIVTVRYHTLKKWVPVQILQIYPNKTYKSQRQD